MEAPSGTPSAPLASEPHTAHGRGSTRAQVYIGWALWLFLAAVVLWTGS